MTNEEEIEKRVEFVFENYLCKKDKVPDCLKSSRIQWFQISDKLVDVFKEYLRKTEEFPPLIRRGDDHWWIGCEKSTTGLLKMDLSDLVKDDEFWEILK